MVQRLQESQSLSDKRSITLQRLEQSGKVWQTSLCRMEREETDKVLDKTKRLLTTSSGVEIGDEFCQSWVVDNSIDNHFVFIQLRIIAVVTEYQIEIGEEDQDKSL